MTTTTDTTMTLSEALRHAWDTRWKYQRGGKSTLAQAEQAVKWLDITVPYGGSSMPISKVTEYAVNRAVTNWYAQGLSPSTINTRLSALAVMGVNVEGHYVKRPKVLQWWMRPEDAAAFRRVAGPRLWAYVDWASHTGLRVEESLRLKWSDFSADFTEVTVPGTKTEASQATLALPSRFAKWMRMFHAYSGGYTGPFSDWPTYDALEAAWSKAKREAGITHPGATLKALRRTAARYLHVDCGMPIDMVRQYLRHERIETTMRYLRLVGGYGVEDQRRFLK